jgi:hypothetical protein
MYTPLIAYYCAYFSDEGKTDRYILLRNGVCLNILNGLYNQFMAAGDVPKIESIDEATKLRLWEQAKKHQIFPDKRKKAMIAAYVLTLITSTE